MTDSKACSVCKQIKPLHLFVKDKYKKSGYKANCLQCSRDVSKRGRAEGRHKIRKYADLSDEQKAKHRARYRAWAKANPDKCIERNKVHRAKHRNYYAQKQAQYRLENPNKYKEWQRRNPAKVIANWTKRRNSLKANGIFSITNKEIRSLLSQPCFYCKSTFSGTIDHVMPLSKGGRHSIGNLLPACMACNQQKRAMLMIEWKMRHGQKTV